MKKRQKGFSLPELLIVCVILGILCTLAVIAGQLVINNYRLSASGSSVASLIIQARIQAVRTNSPFYAKIDNTTTPNMAFITSDGINGTYTAGMPDVEIPPSLALQPATLPNHDQLDNYLKITGSSSSPAWEQVSYIGFNARGLPCVEGAAGAVQCVQLDSNNQIPEFEWFIQAPGPSWEAVTVTAAGRVKAWRLYNNNSSAMSVCNFAACWQ